MLGSWIEKNAPALLVGFGFGAFIADMLFAADHVWMLGSLAGIGVALPLWQIYGERWMGRSQAGDDSE